MRHSTSDVIREPYRVSRYMCIAWSRDSNQGRMWLAGGASPSAVAPTASKYCVTDFVEITNGNINKLKYSTIGYQQLVFHGWCIKNANPTLGKNS